MKFIGIPPTMFPQFVWFLRNLAVISALILSVTSFAPNEGHNSMTWYDPVWHRNWIIPEISLGIEPSVKYSNPNKESVFDSVRMQFPVLLKFDHLIKSAINGGSAKSKMRRKSSQGMSSDHRESVYKFVENMFAKFGHRGRPCTLRMICEIHHTPLGNFGMMGEVVKLIFTPSRSRVAPVELMPYLDAENRGVKQQCGKFVKECPNFSMMSFLKWQRRG